MSNNLFVLWLIHTQTQIKDKYTLRDLTQDIQKVSNKMRFMNFIEDFCSSAFKKNRISENAYFDQSLFNDTIAVIEQYYQIDGELKLLLSKLWNIMTFYKL